MPLITSRKPFNIQNPYRSSRPTSNKIIFLSSEGSVTEEEYFDIVNNIFEEVKTKIQFISVVENAVHTHHKCRTPDQQLLLSKSRPKQLLEKIEQFKIEYEESHQFSKYPEDEFWIVTDVDNNTSPLWIAEWNATLNRCDEKGYSYAISNPFFEIWLLLHFLEVTDDDKYFAVTDSHEYEKTNHFRERLRLEANAPLKDKKHILAAHYNRENILIAVEKAKALHINQYDKWPNYFATTVYLLLEKIIDMIPR